MYSFMYSWTEQFFNSLFVDRKSISSDSVRMLFNLFEQSDSIRIITISIEMPSDNFQSIPIDKEPDVILSIFEKFWEGQMWL